MKRAALITTDKRGVFMGDIDYSDEELKELKGKTIKIENIMMAIYWPAEVQGVIGLAVVGPNKESKITKAGKSGYLEGVTAVIELTPEAEAAWRVQPWG